jgi:hypothetical protein
VFFVWGSTALLSFSFAYFLVPETRGLSLEQVNKMLAETSPRNSSKWVSHETWVSTGGLVEKDTESNAELSGESKIPQVPQVV